MYAFVLCFLCVVFLVLWSTIPVCVFVVCCLLFLCTLKVRRIPNRRFLCEHEYFLFCFFNDRGESGLACDDTIAILFVS